ncbi:MAG: caspase family protein [Cyclobacteriaceae bacterium]
MKNFLSLLLSFFFASSYAQVDTEKFLVVDPQGHNAIVNDIVFSELTNELISVSDDKTIRLWEYDDQLLNRTFRPYSEQNGPEGMIYTADITPDGRYLAIAGYSAQNDIKIIDLQRGEIVDQLIRHKNVVTSVSFSPDGKILASASADKGIILWDAINETGGYQFGSSLYQHQERVNDLDFSPDGKYLVSVSDDETTRIWSSEDFQKDPIVLRNHLGPVKKIAASKLGFVTGGAGGIINFWGYNGNLIQQVAQQQTSIICLSASRYSDLVFVSGDNQYVLNLKNPSRLVSLFSTNKNVTAGYFTSDEKLVLGQGRSGNLIGINLRQLEPEFALSGEGKSLSRLFINGNKLGFNSDNKRVADAYFDLELEQVIRDQSKLAGFKGSTVSDGNFTVAELGSDQISLGASLTVKNSSRDGRILSYTVLPDGRMVVGSDRTLKVYNVDGSLAKELDGHTGQVLSIVNNSQLFFTYGGDQIIKIWSIADLSLKYNMFLTKDFEWILWNASGKYLASAGGEQYLTWQVNREVNEFAEFFDVSAYKDAFMTSSLGKVDEEARETAVELPEKPQIKWNEPEAFQTVTENGRVRIKATVFSEAPVKKTRILVRGQALPSKRGVSEVKEIDEIIDLTSYKTTVQIFVSTEDAKIISEKRVFINPNLKDSDEKSNVVIDFDKKPNLYFVGIGISEFQNSEWNLTYADDDATSLHEVFTDGNSPVYNQVNGQLLLNQDATRGNIIEAFDSLAKIVHPKDQVVLFIASHGINEKGFYYVLTHDADKTNLTGTCLNWSDIADLLGSLPCKVLLFLDTCHSGALGSSITSSEKYLKNTEALREMGSNEVGVVIMSGSTGEESSLESEEWEHGVFTLSLLEGLKEKKADIKSDGVIFLRELDFFVSNNVYELTRGKQNPTTQKPSTISKLIIY